MMLDPEGTDKIGMPTTAPPTTTPATVPTTTPNQPPVAGPNIPKANPAVVIGPLVVGTAQHSGITNWGDRQLYTALHDGKICPEHYDEARKAIRNRKSRGGASAGMQATEVRKIINSYEDRKSKDGCIDGITCLWHYTDKDITGKKLIVQSHMTTTWYPTGISALYGTGIPSTTPPTHRCYVCGPKAHVDAATPAITPNGAPDFVVTKPGSWGVLQCENLCRR